MTHEKSRLVVAVIAGTMFGFGLSLSGMVDPVKVLGFLDIGSGAWDPSLMFVLGGAILGVLPFVLWQKSWAKPVLDEKFHLPTSRQIDRPLVIGSAIFGTGWGLAGFCPGPAITALSTGLPQAFLFVAAMAFGMFCHDRFYKRT